MLAPPAQPAKLCPACTRKGYTLGCPDCKALNTRGGKKPDREPGDEVEPAAAISFRKKIELALLKFRRSLNDLAKANGIGWTDGKDNKPAVYEHPLLQKAFELYMSAKRAALKAEWELRKEVEVPE